MFSAVFVTAYVGNIGPKSPLRLETLLLMFTIVFRAPRSRSGRQSSLMKAGAMTFVCRSFCMVPYSNPKMPSPEA